MVGVLPNLRTSEMTNNNDFIGQTAHQQISNGFLMNGATNMMNSLNTAGSGSGGSTVGVSVNSTQSTGGVGSGSNSLNNGYNSPNFAAVPVQKQFDTESVLSIKSERVGLGIKTNLPNLYPPAGLGRTHSSLSHYNNNSPTANLNANGQQQFVNYGFIGPNTSNNGNKLSAIFPQYQQHTGSQSNLPHVYFPSPQLSTNAPRFNQLASSLNNGSASNLTNTLPGNLPNNLSNNLSNGHLTNNLNGNLNGNLSGNSQQNSPSSIHQQFNSMSNLISASANQAQFSSLINPYSDSPGQFSNNMTMNNRQRSVGRLERRVISNNFKNHNGYANNFTGAINHSLAANNFDDNQSFFNDACTAITGELFETDSV